jgi:hypothetical protein
MLDIIALWMKNIAEENRAITAMFKAAKMLEYIPAPIPLSLVISTGGRNLLFREASLVPLADFSLRSK